MMKEKKHKKYSGFTMVEMLITMMILAVIFLAIGRVVVTMIKTTNVASSRMLVREEGEYISDVLRKYLRNSSSDTVKLYHRSNPRISFSDYEVSNILGVTDENVSEILPATEIHFRPSADFKNRVVCIGYFEDNDEDYGYVVRSVNYIPAGRSWDDYEPSWCFPDFPDDEFRKNFVILNSNLVFMEGLRIVRTRSLNNVYYSIDIDMKPAWGIGGFSNYKDLDGSLVYRKSLVVQTRQLYNW